MKNLYFILIVVVFINTLLSSCKKDNDDLTSKKNYFSVDNKEYELSSGAFKNLGPGNDETVDDGYYLDLILVSSDIYLTEGEDGFMDMIGSGEYLSFFMYSSNSSSLDNWDYHYDETYPYSVGTFYVGESVLNSEELDIIIIKILSGIVTILKSGNEYEITINCTGKNGESIKGYYKGILKYFNYEPLLNQDK